MGKRYVMALDQGTTSSRCIIFDYDGKIVGSAQKEFEQIYPVPGWVEHDPEIIWHSQYTVIMQALLQSKITTDEIAAIGITNQRETTIVWDKNTGKPIYNAIVWQCRRTSEIIDQLKADGWNDYIKETTGLIPDAYFSGSKVKWILDNIPGAREKAKKGDLLFGTVDTWLIWRLTEGKVHATDYTNASRTMLFNIHNLEWDQKLLDLFDIPRCMLPEVKPSSYLYGYTTENTVGGKIPISGVAGDQQAALFGQCCFNAGDIKNTYGTGCFMLLNTGSKAVDSKIGLITTIAASLDGHIQYALEGSIFAAGASVQWLRDELHIIESPQETEPLANTVEDTAGAYVVPAFTGLGAPYWNQYARGIIVGMTRGFGKAHLVRATVEAIAYQVYDIIEAMAKEADVSIKELKVDGGVSANNFLLQFQSDLLNAKVMRPKNIETTALGAAYLAGLAIGYWKNTEELKKQWSLAKSFEPKMDNALRSEKIKGWKKAIKVAIAWAQEE